MDFRLNVFLTMYLFICCNVIMNYLVRVNINANQLIVFGGNCLHLH